MEYRGVSGLNGSYKLSEKVINRILSREFLCDDDKVDTVSNFEILTLVHFSQICDISGVIEEYRILDLEDVVGCSRRACYNIISNLENKGFISQSGASWNGYRRIVLLNNDFSDADYSSLRYVNTNYTYLNHYHSDYSEFKKLSLYAKKALLVILLKYNNKYGYRVEINTLKEYLGVSQKSKVMGYIDELRSMFDERIFVVSSSKKERLKNHNLYISSKMPCFVAETGISEFQDCYTKFRLELLFRKNNVLYESIAPLKAEYVKEGQIHKLYSIYVHYISKGLSVKNIEDAVMQVALSCGKIDELAIFNINQLLDSLIKNVS